MMPEEMSILRDLFGKDADIDKSSVWDDGEYIVNGKHVTVDVRWQKIYYDAGKDRGQEEKGVTEDEMVEWHHRLNGHEFEQALRDGEGQGRLACCSSWGCKELDMT